MRGEVGSSSSSWLPGEDPWDGIGVVWRSSFSILARVEMQRGTLENCENEKVGQMKMEAKKPSLGGETSRREHSLNNNNSNNNYFL